MLEKRFKASAYYPGGRWEVWQEDTMLDWFAAEWEADRFIARRHG